MTRVGISLVFAAMAAGAASFGGDSRATAQLSAAGASPPVFRDIVRRELLPQLRAGKVVRGQLGLQLHGGPILEDEANELRLPAAGGTIVMLVDTGSAAERAGLRAGDVIVEIDGMPVADTRDLIARTAAASPGTLMILKTFRDGHPHTRTATIEAQPADDLDPVHTAADARRELRGIAPGRPIFLVVWRSGVEAFLEMRKR